MKRFVFLFLLSTSLVTINAQELVRFNLKPDGTFQTDDEKSFAIVEFEGKTAQELFNMVKANVLTLYNSPKTVMNEIEPSNITIRARSEKLYSTYKLGTAFVEYRANYNLVFQFKDGRIKIDAPLVDKQLDVSATAVPLPKTFISLIDDWFEKNGQIKKKKQKLVTKVEDIFNYPINYLLGNLNQVPSTDNEDW